MAQGQFVHFLFGSAEFRKRNKSTFHTKAVNDIRKHIERPHQVDAVTFCFGRENEAIARDLGLNAYLCCEESTLYPVDDFWRNKLAMLIMAWDYFRCPLQYVDFDVVQRKPLPDDFWERTAKKDTLQAVCEQYRRPISKFRVGDDRKLNSGKFVYMADRETCVEVDNQFNHKDKSRSSRDELAITATIMDRMGGWQDNHDKALREMLLRFEPYSAVARRHGNWIHWPEYKDTKELIFRFPKGKT